MKESNNLNQFSDIMDTILSSCIPDGTVETFENDDFEVSFKKDNGHLEMEIKAKAKVPECDKEFDDTEIKEIVSEYKDNIKALDDDLFIEVIEELKSKLDLKKFNELLDLESFNKEQAREVEEMINISSDIICLHLQHKIQDMVELYEQF